MKEFKFFYINFHRLPPSPYLSLFLFPVCLAFWFLFVSWPFCLLMPLRFMSAEPKARERLPELPLLAETWRHQAYQGVHIQRHQP